jgi:uncharacterized Zn-finger protein
LPPCFHFNLNNNLKCYICGEKFTSKENLWKHSKNVHKSIKDFGCSICAIQSERKSNLEQHLKILHTKLKILNAAFAIKNLDQRLVFRGP